MRFVAPCILFCIPVLIKRVKKRNIIFFFILMVSTYLDICKKVNVADDVVKPYFWPENH